MIYPSPPTGKTYFDVSTIQYTDKDGREIVGLVLSLYRVGQLVGSTGIDYEPTLSDAEHERQMREDVIALYIRATLFDQVAFVCEEEALRKSIRDGLVGIAETSRTKGSVLTRVLGSLPVDGTDADGVGPESL